MPQRAPNAAAFFSWRDHIQTFALGFDLVSHSWIHYGTLPATAIFARTVINSLRQFVDFALIFVIIFLTFSFIGNSLFGKQVLQFSMASNSMESCMNMLFGEFDYNSIRYITGSGVFYWTCMVVVSLILLNMMLAIVMGSYKNMSKEGYNGAGSRLLFSRLRHDPPDELRDWFRKLGLSKNH